MKKLLVTFLAVTVALVLYSCDKKVNAPAAPEQPKVEQPSTPSVSTVVEKKLGTELGKAPEYEVTLLDGSKLSSKSLAGKIVVIDFWATWCGPCRMEIPWFINLYKKYKDQNVVILGISLDRAGKTVVEKFCKDTSVNYPIAIDENQVVTNAFGKIFGQISGIPTTFVIDQAGMVRSKHVGVTQEAQFDSEISALLK
ncbi:MAG: TlpA disulfide reductase family protein [Elusimicrobiota bacterium]